MSEESTLEERPPVVEVARPDIAPPKVDSLGRSMVNKRGRKPGPQGPRGEKLNTQSALAGELGKRLPTDSKMLSDAMVGEAISGAFSAIGIFGGPHWRLFPQESAKFGEVFGPLARLYGAEELAKWITILMCLPVCTEVLGPRIAISSMIAKKELPKEEGRKFLLHIKGMMAAEKDLDIDMQAKESAAYLRAQVATGMSVAADMSVEQMTKEGVVNGA